MQLCKQGVQVFKKLLYQLQKIVLVNLFSTFCHQNTSLCYMNLWKVNKALQLRLTLKTSGQLKGKAVEI